MAYKAVFNDNYLCHFNKNHSSKNGQFVSGDGDGDGITNDNKNQKKKSRVYSAKIENYHKGTLTNDPYYIDKNGNKRSYDSIKDMPYDVQKSEKARANGKKMASKVGSVVLGTITAAAVAAGTTYLAYMVNANIKKAARSRQREKYGDLKFVGGDG